MNINVGIEGTRAAPDSTSGTGMSPYKAWCESRGMLLEALLEEFSFGVATIGENGRLLFANRVAWSRIRGGTLLRVTEGRLEGGDAKTDQNLRHALAGAQCGRRGYLTLGCGAGRYSIAVLPVGDTSEGGTVVALVFEKDPVNDSLGLFFFARAHGLTPTEGVVLRELGEGVTVQHVAAKMQVSPHTVRTHVRGVLSKTGEAGLRRLVRRIGLLPPIGTRVAPCAGTTAAPAAEAGRPADSAPPPAEGPRDGCRMPEVQRRPAGRNAPTFAAVA